MTAQDELADSEVPPQLDLSISYNNTPIQFALRRALSAADLRNFAAEGAEISGGNGIFL